ncbi:MAG TPA: hypothetical protein VK957_18240 [Lunatimonas sp.]|nr:hypothetical protein [Lunatimonas sp.]
MENQHIQLKAERSISAIISDSFEFARSNFDALKSLFMKGLLIPFIILVLLSGIQAAYTPVSFSTDPDITPFGLTYFLMMVASVVYMVLMIGIVLNLVKAYANNTMGINESDVIFQGRKVALSLLGYVVVMVILVVLGMILLVLPGIFIYVPLMVGYVALVMENKSIKAAISRGFQLVKGEWWVTFGTLLGVGIVFGIISFAFQLPVFVYGMMRGFGTAEEVSASAGGVDIVAAVLTMVSVALTYLLYIVFIIALALIYFDLDEKKGSTGLLEQIKHLGKEEL